MTSQDINILNKRPHLPYLPFSNQEEKRKLLCLLINYNKDLNDKIKELREEIKHAEKTMDNNKKKIFLEKKKILKNVDEKLKGLGEKIENKIDNKLDEILIKINKMIDDTVKISGESITKSLERQSAFTKDDITNYVTNSIKKEASEAPQISSSNDIELEFNF